MLASNPRRDRADDAGARLADGSVTVSGISGLYNLQQVDLDDNRRAVLLRSAGLLAPLLRQAEVEPGRSTLARHLLSRVALLRQPLPRPKHLTPHHPPCPRQQSTTPP